MKHLLFLLFTTTAIAQQTSPNAAAIYSPGDQLNQLLPKWFQLSGEYRLRFEGYQGLNYKTTSSDSYFLERFRLGIQIKPSPWVKVVGQLQDARAFEKSTVAPVPPFQNIWDLRLAYAEFGDTEKSPLALRVGRQEINLGEERLVGMSNWVNNPRVFDAVRGTVRLHAYRLDAFTSSLVNAYDHGFDHHLPGNNLHGIYATTNKVVPKATFDHYVMWRVGPGQKTEAGAPAKLNEWIYGIRIAGALPLDFDYSTEMVVERGSIGSDDIAAWAGHWVVGRSFKKSVWTPRVFGEFNYASGDSNSKDGHRGTFDNLYPSNHDKYGLADQVGWKNIKHLRAGIELKPSKQWTLGLRGEDWWLANSTDALYTATGAAVARVTTGTAGTHIGEELDIFGTYSPAKPFSFGAGLSHILPGEFIKHTTPSQKYTSPYIFAQYKF